MLKYNSIFDKVRWLLYMIDNAMCPFQYAAVCANANVGAIKASATLIGAIRTKFFILSSLWQRL